jgi:Protein of unknown function (DUF3592)
MKTVRVLLGIFFVAGIGMLIGACFTFQHTRTFLGTAAKAEGVVVELVYRETHDSQGTGRAYHPRVRFQTSQGQDVEFVSSVGANPPSYKVNQRIEVVYDPLDPARAYVHSFASLWLSTLILGILGVAFLTPRIGWSVWQRLNDRKAAWLRENGRRVQAEIESIQLNTSVQVGGRNPYRILCQWLDPVRNEVHVFQSRNIWFDPADYLQGRTTLDVLIDPENPRRYLVDTSFLPNAV